MCTAPPVLVNVSPDVVVRNEGDDVDIFCEATATPAATLTWHKDGRELASSGHVTVAGNHVVLRGVERSDAGVYSCAFKNVAGTVSHLIKLVVQGMFTLSHNSTLTPTLNVNGQLSDSRTVRIVSNLLYYRGLFCSFLHHIHFDRIALQA